MPFALAWIVLWVVLTAIIMAIVYRLDPANRQVAHDRGPAHDRARRSLGRPSLWASSRAAGQDMSLEQWTVGGRSFGTAFVFLLMAGEIYTTFTFLGGSGFAYGKGAPVYYILAYGTLAYILVVLDAAADLALCASSTGCVSQPHFFARKYDSPALGMLVALVGVAALIPYLVLQLKGLGIIVATASYGAISSTAAVWIGAAVVTAYVIVSGVRGSAWNSVVKDMLILAVVLFLGIYLPLHYYGGFSDMFRAIDAAQARLPDLRGQGLERHLVPVHRAADRAGLLHVAAHLRLDFHGQGRAHFPPQRDGAAALPADPAVRVLRRLRGDAEGAGPEGRRHRPVPVPPVAADLRPVVRRRDRRGRHSDRAGAGFDDPSPPRRCLPTTCLASLSPEASDAAVAHRQVAGAGRGAGRGGFHPAWRRDHRGAAADGLQLRDAAVSRRHRAA